VAEKGIEPTWAWRELPILRIALLRTFNRWYGPYRSPTLDIVLTRLPYAGIEYPEIVFSDPDRATITHEVAHQWFYAIVGDNQYREPWLDESFASWSEEQLNRGEYGCNPAKPFGRFPYGLSRGLAYFNRHPGRYTDDDYTDVVYRGGSCALTVLERELGSKRFLALLRREVARYRYRVVDSRDFIALIAAVDPAVARSWARLTHLH
jgi:Peptidase family M1 domain